MVPVSPSPHKGMGAFIHTKKTGAGGAGFDAQWDAGFVHPIREAIISQDDHDRSMDAVREAVLHMYNGDGNTRGLSGHHVDVHHVNNNDKVIAFHRWEQGRRSRCHKHG